MEKKQDLWDKKQEDTCGYCAYGKRMADGDHVICLKRKNIYDFSHSCKKFQFDIMKKEVRRAKKPDFSKFSASDFKI